MKKILIIGSGDVGRRLIPHLIGRYQLYVLVRSEARADEWRQLGVTPLRGDLDLPRSLSRLAGLCDYVIHLAPPPNSGNRDSRTRHLLAALGRGKSLPRRLIYVSTTGVYGDCAGVWIDETRRLHPESPRAERRVDAERTLRYWGQKTGVATVILRAPGIYATDRLPIERLQKGIPALLPDEDVFTNHIHAEDLAAACVAALHAGRSGRVWNVVDDSDLKMGAYFDLVAEAFELPPPPRLSKEALKQAVSPVQWSFMRESRRIANGRLKKELKFRFAFPSVIEGIASAKTALRRAAC